MKRTFYYIALFIIINVSLVSAQENEGNTVKNTFNINAYGNFTLKYFPDYMYLYSIDASYGFAKRFDAGLYFTKDLISGDKHNELGIVSRYFLTSYIFKKPVKVDLYLKGYLGNAWRTNHYADGITQSFTKINYGIMAGFKYLPAKWVGLMTEFGYNHFNGNTDGRWMVTLGASFRINK
jgi:hypothetical protein